jgi:hypothetical protein
LSIANGLIPKYRMTLCVKNKQLLKDDRNEYYYSFNLFIRGLTENAGNVEVMDIDTNQKIYYHAD